MEYRIYVPYHPACLSDVRLGADCGHAAAMAGALSRLDRTIVRLLGLKGAWGMRDPGEFVASWRMAPVGKVSRRPVERQRLPDGALLTCDDAAGRGWPLIYSRD